MAIIGNINPTFSDKPMYISVLASLALSQDDGRAEQGARADALAGTREGTRPAEFLGLKAGPWPVGPGGNHRKTIGKP